jgi:hypothetical protein
MVGYPHLCQLYGRIFLVNYTLVICCIATESCQLYSSMIDDLPTKIDDFPGLC